MSNLDAVLNRAHRQAEARVIRNMPGVAPLQKSVADYARIAVGDIYDGHKRNVAPWVVDKHAYVDVYKGSVYIAIGAIAKKVAEQNVKVLRLTHGKSGTKTDPVAYDHPLMELFRDVNPFDTEWDLWFYTIGFRLLTGDSYIWKSRNLFGTPVQLWMLPSPWVHVVPSQDEFIRAYQVDSLFGVPETFLPEQDVIHIQEPNLDKRGAGRFYGFPPTRAADTSIDLENEMLKRLYHQFKNFAHPGMVFSTDRSLHEHQLRQIYAQLAAQHSAAEHTGRPLITHSNLRLQGEFSHNVKELDFQNSLMSTLEYTLSVFGVPKAIVGLLSDHNRCLDAETECLTDKGWKSYEKLDLTTKIACFDPETHQIVYRKPLHVHTECYQGPMHYWRSKVADICVTPNHKLYGRPGDSGTKRCGPWQARFADEWSKRKSFRLLAAPPNGAVNTLQLNNKQNHSIQEYDGVVWCVQVPTGHFVVRRNGKVHITGNSNVVGALSTFALNTVNPLCTHLSQHLTQKLAMPDFGKDLVVQVGPMVVDDLESTIKAITAASRSGAVTPNDVREELFKKQPYLFGGDRPVLNAGMIEGQFGDEEPPPEEPVVPPGTNPFMDDAQPPNGKPSNNGDANEDDTDGDDGDDGDKADDAKKLKELLASRQGVKKNKTRRS